MFASRSFLTFLQTILHALDLSSLLVLRQMYDAKDDGEHRMAPLPLLHLLPKTLLHVGQLLPHGSRQSLSLSGFFDLQG
jgi:hypothetical protein